MPTKINVTEFAERVERFCDFLLAQDIVTSDDVNVIQKLKEDAANVQFQVETNITLKGLDEYMRGMPSADKEP